jgi:hypothetical protein
MTPTFPEGWTKEIARRIEELDSGKVKTVPRTEAKAQIAAILNSKRDLPVDRPTTEDE